VKFVIGSREDYEWARDRVCQFSLTQRVHSVLFSPVFGQIEPVKIVNWIGTDKLDVRFQLQLHKLIWDPAQRGV
jgi:7-carboxy-7-deazaguanine synthase